MPLTPQDVHSKVFGPTRFRRGYDEAEVDAFLDEVEAELTRLHREIDSLRAQLGGGSSGAADGSPADVAETSSMAPVAADQGSTGETPHSETAASAQAAAQSVSQGQDGGNLEQQVARALVLAQRAADEAVRDAEQQAEQLRRSAQTEAERIRAEVAEQAERERRDLERTRAEAEDEVEQLRAFEREYRTRLRAYLQHQLHELEDPNQQVEGGQSGALPGGADDGTDSSVLGDAASGQLPSDLPTTDLPSDDAAAVPHVSPLSGGPEIPPSVTVSDYSPPSGVGREAAGDELRHERRDLHDGL
jgi:DivIVA domain-containing protein